MTEEAKKEIVERSLSGSQIRALSVIIEADRIGVRLLDTTQKSGLGSNTESVLNRLEVDGMVTSRVIQTGTGGSCERFWSSTEGVCIKVFVPQTPQKS